MSPGSSHIHKTPDIIDVDDYSVILDDNRHTNCDNFYSPDELNILSLSTEGAFPSKYAFDIPGHCPAVRNINPPIVPDGENSEWEKKKYSQVKEKAAKVEVKAGVENLRSRIDLRTTLKTKEMKKIKVCPFSLSIWRIHKTFILF
jgi:hypothetical protein